MVKNRTFGHFQIKIWALNVKVGGVRRLSHHWGRELLWAGMGRWGGERSQVWLEEDFWESGGW